MNYSTITVLGAMFAGGLFRALRSIATACFLGLPVAREGSWRTVAWGGMKLDESLSVLLRQLFVLCYNLNKWLDSKK